MYCGVSARISMGAEVTGGSCRWTTFLHKVIFDHPIIDRHILYTIGVFDNGARPDCLSIDRRDTRFQGETLSSVSSLSHISHKTHVVLDAPIPKFRRDHFKYFSANPTAFCHRPQMGPIGCHPLQSQWPVLHRFRWLICHWRSDDWIFKCSLASATRPNLAYGNKPNKVLKLKGFWPFFPCSTIWCKWRRKA